MISENSEKIFELKLNASSVDELTQTEVYQHVGGKIAAFESDCENVRDDTNEKAIITQAFYILDENQKIYRIVDDDGLKFKV